MASLPLTPTVDAQGRKSYALEDLSDILISQSMAVLSDVTGIAGASAVANMVVISQSDYDALASTEADTFYVIVG